MTTAAATHAAKAIAYAESLMADPTLSSRLTRLAAERFLHDLARTDWPYRFDASKAERICDFASMLPHVKGEWASRGELIRLETWQQFILCNVFGWVEIDTGYRRFREAYIEVPRKNAKSTLSAIVAHYMLSLDGEEGAGIYSAATTRDQARITFDDGRIMALKSPEYRARFGVEVGQHAIFRVEHNSTWKPITREGAANEGLNVHFGLLDELHAHKTRDIFGVIRQGMGSRRQPILWMITTAGSDQSGVCYEQRQGIVNILNGAAEHAPELERTFGVIYTIDSEDDPYDPASWRKANPNFGVSIYESDMAAAAAKAQLLAGERAEYLTKRLNVWVTAADPWFDAAAWRRSAVREWGQLIPEEFDGRECYIGIDFATRRDIAALVALFPDDAGARYSVFGRYYLPDLAIRESNIAAYSGWVSEGWITATPGDTTDFAFIKRDLLDWCARFDVREVAFDPREARQFSTEMLNDYSVPMIELRRGYAAYNEAMKSADALIVEGKIRHNGDPVLSWAVGNVIARSGAMGDVMPDRETADAKIDPAMAMLMALGRAILQEGGGYAGVFFV